MPAATERDPGSGLAARPKAARVLRVRTMLRTTILASIFPAPDRLLPDTALRDVPSGRRAACLLQQGARGVGDVGRDEYGIRQGWSRPTASESCVFSGGTA